MKDRIRFKPGFLRFRGRPDAGGKGTDSEVLHVVRQTEKEGGRRQLCVGAGMHGALWGFRETDPIVMDITAPGPESYSRARSSGKGSTELREGLSY